MAGNQVNSAVVLHDSDEGNDEIEDGKQVNLQENEEQWKDNDFLSFEKFDSVNDGEDNSLNRNNNEIHGNSTCIIANNVSTGNLGRKLKTDNLAIGASQVDEDLPPWMNKHPSLSGGYSHVPMVALHNEIVDFAALMAPQPDEIKEREKLTQEVKQIIVDTFGKKNCRVEVFGSQATGLSLPSSDIDFVTFLDDDDGESKEKSSERKRDDSSSTQRKIQKNKRDKIKEQEELEAYDVNSVVASGSPLVRLGNALRAKWQEKLTYLEVIENTRIPIVKFIHGPTNISGDICLNQTAGPQAAELMKRFLEAMPPLKPLTFVLKYFMASRELNEPYTGGMGSFMLQMMIVSFLQHREREEFNNNRSSVVNLGSLLIEFFELYGVDFNYITTGISVRSDGFYFPKGSKDRKEYFWQPARQFSLALENPLDPTADVGRASFRMQLIQRSFEVAFRILLAHVSEPPIQAKSILAAILPPSEEMHKRATMLKVLKIEQQIEKQGFSLPALVAGRNDGGKPRNEHKRQRSSNRELININSSSDEERLVQKRSRPS